MTADAPDPCNNPSCRYVYVHSGPCVTTPGELIYNRDFDDELAELLEEPVEMPAPSRSWYAVARTSKPGGRPSGSGSSMWRSVQAWSRSPTAGQMTSSGWATMLCTALSLAIQSHGESAGAASDRCFPARARVFEAYLRDVVRITKDVDPESYEPCECGRPMRDHPWMDVSGVQVIAFCTPLPRVAEPAPRPLR